MDVTFWVCVCVLTLIGLIFRHVTRNFDHWKKKNVPYVPPIPIFGNMFKVVTIQQSVGHYVQEVYNYTNSRFTGFYIFDQPFLLLRDPQLIKTILIKDFEHFDRRTILENRRDDEMGSKTLLILGNPEWRPVRNKLTPVLTKGKIKGMLHLILETSKDVKDFVGEAIANNNGVIDSKELGRRYSTEVIASCVFGINAHAFIYENAEFNIATRRLFNFTISRAIQWTSYFVAPWLAKLFRMRFLEAKATQFLRSVFLEQMEQRKLSNSKRGDFVDTILQMKEEYGENIDGEVLVAQALQFFIAGFETTGSTISFALYEMAVNQDVQKRLRDEIKKTLEIHGELTYEAIMDMKYLSSIVDETLRKYPPLTFLDRRCTKAYKIPDTDVTIEEGIPIYISLLGLHMDPAYFPEPDKFNPDRFSDENKSSIVPFTYMPFGEGPRNCIGERFGLLSVKSALIAVFSNFMVELDARTPVPMTFDTKTGFLISPKGGVLYLRFKKCP